MENKPHCEIVFVRYKAPEIEDAALESLKLTNIDRVTYSVTEIDNCDPVTQGNVRTLTQIWNDTIEASPHEVICLLNSDILIQDPLWLEKLVLILLADPQLACTGPSTNNCVAGPQHGLSLDVTRKPTLCKYVDALTGFCLVIKKSVWQAIGKFDERFAFYGNETEFNDRAMRHGYKLGFVRAAFVFHRGEATVKRAEARGEYQVKDWRKTGMDLWLKTKEKK